MSHHVLPQLVHQTQGGYGRMGISLFFRHLQQPSAGSSHVVAEPAGSIGGGGGGGGRRVGEQCVADCKVCLTCQLLAARLQPPLERKSKIKRVFLFQQRLKYAKDGTVTAAEELGYQDAHLAALLPCRYTEPPTSGRTS